jgi:flagellar hook-associated protein 2
MSSAVLTTVKTGSSYDRLSSIGISLQRDGTLQLDESKLDAAIATDSGSVTALLAGPANGQGVMTVMNDVAKMFTEYQSGLLPSKQTSLDKSATDWTLRAQQEQDRLKQYSDSLLKQFDAMNSTVSQNTSTMNYLTQLYGTTSSK